MIEIDVMTALRALLVLPLVAGCSTAIALTDGGRTVTAGEHADMPGGCRLISDVRIGHPPDASMPPTREDLVILMRNKTHTQGGNYVVVESVEERDTNDDGEVFYRGRGTSYRCPDQPRSAGPEEGGDDATAGGEDEDSGEGSDDDSLDDLLGD